MSLGDQQKAALRAVLREERAKCWTKILTSLDLPAPENASGPAMCPVVWDNILCWDAAPAGTQQKQRCPEYVPDMNHQAYAYRYCDSDGRWYQHEQLNKTWTDYLQCLSRNLSHLEGHAEHGDNLQLIQTIGYGVSLCSLVIAVLIMCCSRLKSKSNTLHVNLFLAFILRASSAFTNRLLFVENVGLAKDVNRTAEGHLEFIEEGLHWECRLLFSVFIYSLCASQTWIFVEGLYLHMLIYRTLSTERNGVRCYILLGWAIPFAILAPWVGVKALADNVGCWNFNRGFLWLIQGPMLASVMVNFFFFLNIFRVLCTRIRSSQRHVGRTKYRQLAKFILVLIPLFGVIHIILNLVFPNAYTDPFDLVPLYVEQTYNAFQGFILAMLFCFLNEEVHNEIKRVWWRRRTRRRDSAVTRSYVLSSFRRGNSYTTRVPSTKAVHPLRSACCRASTTSSIPSTHRRQTSWSVRLKRRVLELWGRGYDRKGSIVKMSPTTPPPFVHDGCGTGLGQSDHEELEMRMKLTGQQDVSSG